MEKLNHEPGKTFESARYTDSRADFNEDSTSGMNVYLQLSGFVDGRIEKRKKTLQAPSAVKQKHLLLQKLTWCVISGRASLISRFILRMIPICSSLFNSEYLSSRIFAPRPPAYEAR